MTLQKHKKLKYGKDVWCAGDQWRIDLRWYNIPESIIGLTVNWGKARRPMFKKRPK